MRLLVTTPLAVVVDARDVRHVRAEDDSGAFGILRGHADLVTVLAVSVVTWRGRDGGEHYVAVRRGVLTVRGGDTVEVATGEAVCGDDLRELETAVLARLREEIRAEEVSRASAARLQVAAIRQICRYLRPEPGRAPGPGRMRPMGRPENGRPGSTGPEGEHA